MTQYSIFGFNSLMTALGHIRVGHPVDIQNRSKESKISGCFVNSTDVTGCATSAPCFYSDDRGSILLVQNILLIRHLAKNSLKIV